MKTFLQLLKEAFSRWREHNATKMSASLSYYTALSMAPLVGLILSIVSLAYERADARKHLVDQFTAMIGPEGAKVAEGILSSSASTGTGVWSAIVSFVVLLMGASGVFGELQDSLNRIWEAPVPKGRTLLTKIKDRLASFAMVLVIGFLLIVSLLLSTAI